MEGDQEIESLPDDFYAPFSAEKCAKLHNRLLSLSTQHLVDGGEPLPDRVNVLDHFLQGTADDWTEDVVNNPLEYEGFRFLSLIEHRGEERPTPGLRSPRLDLLAATEWLGLDEEDPELILLYPDPIGWHPGIPGGVLFNLGELRACFCPAGLGPARTSFDLEQWPPLEFILRKHLALWETGKCHWNPIDGRITYVPWIQADLDDALAAWGELLASIEARLPLTTAQLDYAYLEPLDRDLLTSLKLSSFAVEFLCHAKRPGFKFIAPGITTFSPETLISLCTNP